MLFSQLIEYPRSLVLGKRQRGVINAGVLRSAPELPTPYLVCHCRRPTVVNPDTEPLVLRVLENIPTPYLSRLLLGGEFFPHGGRHILHGQPRFIRPLDLEQEDPVRDLLPG